MTAQVGPSTATSRLGKEMMGEHLKLLQPKFSEGGWKAWHPALFCSACRPAGAGDAQ